jgi:hypothetical protein
MGRALIPRVHNLNHIKLIAIFCFEVEKYQYLKARYPKVQFIHNDFGKILEFCKGHFEELLNKMDTSA